MSFNNSSSAVTNSPSSRPPAYITHILIFPIAITLSILLLSILIFLFISKCPRKEQKKIQRQNIIIKKNFQSKSDIPDDPNTNLFEQNEGGMISDTRYIPYNDIDNPYDSLHLPNPMLAQKITDTSRDSTISVSSPHLSITNPSNEINDNEDLSNFNFANIPLRRLKLSNKILTDTSLLQISNRSFDSVENPYIAEFKQQEKEKAEARKKYISAQRSTSEESCL